MSLTLAIVGNTNHSLMSFSLEKTLSNVNVDKIKIFSDKPIPCSKEHEFHELTGNFGLYQYSTFMIKKLADYIETDHVLVTQYDGFATNSEMWNDKFLEYDYIGSPTYYKHPPLYTTLNNCDITKALTQKWYTIGGGFSLRSKKFQKALQDDRIKEKFYNHAIKADWSCEDISIAIIYKDFLEKEYGIRYAPIDVAIDFSAEILVGYEYCLGFHGWDNVPIHCTEEETLYYIRELLNTYGVKIDRNRLHKFLGFCMYKNYVNVWNETSVRCQELGII